jgi:hypothetical protein
MRMMGKWMEVGAHRGIRVKLTVDSQPGAYWDGWDVWQHFEIR